MCTRLRAAQEDLAAGASHQLRGRLAMSQFDRGIVPQRGLEEARMRHTPSPHRIRVTEGGVWWPRRRRVSSHLSRRYSEWHWLVSVCRGGVEEGGDGICSS